MRYDGRDDGRVEPSLDGPGRVAPDAGPEPPPAPRRRRHFGLIVVPALALLSAAAVAIGALFIYYTVVFPNPLSMRPSGTGPVIRILGYDGSLIAERGVSRAYMPLDLLPPHVAEAVVATEDQRFYEHMGIDPLGMLRAAFANLRTGRLAQGGSTLTQQLAKNLFLTPERTFSRKAEELVLALWLELKLSKRDILELYLNRVYFGAGAYGIEAASERYFGKSASALTLAEAAVVAGLLKAPSKYSPSTSSVLALARARVVIGRMVDAGFLTEAEAEAARATEVHFSPLMHVPDQAEMGYAADYVLEAAAQFEGADRDEIVIETTLDAALQRRATEVVEEKLREKGETLGAGQAAAVILAPDGAVRALVGGRDYGESQFNRAVKARRQPGSAFKPVVYLTAVERGLTPDSIVEDTPVTVGNWSPKNDNDRYIGATTLRNALAQSINSVAVRLVLDAGPDRVAAMARRLGMKSVLRSDATLALGTSEVSLIDLTGAYGAFANGGYVNEPYAIRRVRTGTGRVLFERVEAHSAPALPLASVAAMNDMLETTLISGTGKRAALAGHPAAGKTGTSQDFRDAWFIGYTAYLTGGVWVGNDDGTPMNRVAGGTLPAEIWREVMRVAHAGKPPRPLPAVGDRPKDPVGDTRSGPEAAGEAAPPDPIARILAEGASEATNGPPPPQGDTSVAPGGRILVRPPPVP